MIDALKALIRRLRCRHAWRYSHSRSARTATEICRRCAAIRRMPRGPRYAAPSASPFDRSFNGR